ncbi:hypothetical protein M3Y97_00162300 [Aphelenchoides bicaudatus]|nr:hypothetical protein M3Y97_00162300 [Aphelenchoides bicaudatus]
MARKERGKYRNQDPQSYVTIRPKRVQKKEAIRKDPSAMDDSSFIEIIEYNADGTEKKILPIVSTDLIDENSADLNANTTVQQKLDHDETPNQSSSFIEVIEREKEESSNVIVELVDRATTSSEQSNDQLNEQADAYKENTEHIDESSSPEQRDDEPVSIFVSAGKELDDLATPEKAPPASKSKTRTKKKKGGRKGKKDFVRSIDPSLLKTPPASCFKSSRSNLSDSPKVLKSFRFADTRGEGPLCDIKEVDYENDRKYGFRKTTIKKSMYSEFL